MTLWELKPLESTSIQDLKDHPDRFRLESLGFFPDTQVLCLHTTALHGPKVYQVGDHIISLDQEAASIVLVASPSSTPVKDQ